MWIIGLLLKHTKNTKYNKFETKSIQNLILDCERMNVVCKFKKNSRSTEQQIKHKQKKNVFKADSNRI